MTPAGGDEAVGTARSGRLPGRVAIVLALLALVALVSLQILGRRSRTLSDAPSEPALATPTVVETSAELLDTLDARHAHGRTLVYLSRFLHFVPIDAAVPEGITGFPLAVSDLGPAI